MLIVGMVGVQRSTYIVVPGKPFGYSRILRKDKLRLLEYLHGTKRYIL